MFSVTNAAVMVTDWIIAIALIIYFMTSTVELRSSRKWVLRWIKPCMMYTNYQINSPPIYSCLQDWFIYCHDRDCYRSFICDQSTEQWYAHILLSAPKLLIDCHERQCSSSLFFALEGFIHW